MQIGRSQSRDLALMLYGVFVGFSLCHSIVLLCTFRNSPLLLSADLEAATGWV